MSAQEKRRPPSSRRRTPVRKVSAPNRCILCDQPAEREWAHIPVCAEHHDKIFEEVRLAGVRGERPLYRKLTQLFDQQVQGR